MQNLYFLFPAMNIPSGGHVAQLKLLEAANSITPAQAVTYETRAEGVPFLEDMLRQKQTEDAIFFVHWGPHVPGLIEKLKGKNVVYVAHSTGYAFSLPPEVPVIAVSRHTQAYWGRFCPGSLIFQLPTGIAPEFTNRHQARDIDILVQKRKSSRYLLDELVPALAPQANLKLVDTWVGSLSELFNRSKVYLYDSTEYWYQNRVSEGFGLPPLEALASGCTVFSSLNDGLSDYLDPGFNAFQIRAYSLENDVNRILKAVREWRDTPAEPAFLAHYRWDAIRERFASILAQLDEFFTARRMLPASKISLAVLPPAIQENQLLERLASIENSRAWHLVQLWRKIRTWPDSLKTR